MGVNYLDPQKSVIAWLVLFAAIAGLCLLLWLLNKLLRKLGVKDHRVDRLGASMLEMERLIRPSAEHVLMARSQRKVTLPSGEDNPPEGPKNSGAG